MPSSTPGVSETPCVEEAPRVEETACVSTMVCVSDRGPVSLRGGAIPHYECGPGVCGIEMCVHERGEMRAATHA